MYFRLLLYVGFVVVIICFFFPPGSCEHTLQELQKEGFVKWKCIFNA